MAWWTLWLVSADPQKKTRCWSFLVCANGDRANNQAAAAPPGEEADRPADQHQEAVLESDQIPQVYDEPGDPGRKPAEPDPVQVCHRAGPADRRQVSLVAVAERLVRAPAQPRFHDIGGVAALLHCDGGDSRERLGPAIVVAHAHHVPQGEDPGAAGGGQIGRDGDAPGSIQLGTRLLGEASSQPGG